MGWRGFIVLGLLSPLFLAPRADAQICDITALRNAITAANSSGGTITLTAGCTMTFTNATPGRSDLALPPITGTVTIDGNGGHLDRSENAALFRFLAIEPGATLTLKNIKLERGHAPDGTDGVDAREGLGGNGAGSGTQGADGGAIHNRGTLLLENVRLLSNSAGNGGSGGRCANGRSGGFGAAGGKGGAIFNAGTLTVRYSTLSHNLAGDGGSGGGCSDTEQGGNGAVAGSGGAIWSEGSGSTLIQWSTLHDNETGEGGDGGSGSGSDDVGAGGNGGDGGGIMAWHALTIEDSTIEANVAGHGGTGGGEAPAGTGGYGGGVAVWTGSLLVKRSTFAGNAAGAGNRGATLAGQIAASAAGGGGGVFVNTAAVIENSTFARNYGSKFEGFSCGVGGNGGGLYVGSGGNVGVRNVTFSLNQPGYGDTCQDSTGLIFGSLGTGAAIHNAGTLHLSNTIVDSRVFTEHGGTPLFPAHCAGTPVIDDSPGKNMIFNDTEGRSGINYTGPGYGCPMTFSEADPRLPAFVLSTEADGRDPSAGPATLRPDAFSPAINAGENSLCPGPDQRGVARPQGTNCEIGSYETTLTLVQSPTDQTVSAGSATFTALVDTDGQSNPTVVWQTSLDGGATWAAATGTKVVTNLGNSQFRGQLTVSNPSVSQHLSQFRAVFSNTAVEAGVTTAAATLYVPYTRFLTDLPAQTSGNVGGYFPISYEYDAYPATQQVQLEVAKNAACSVWSNFIPAAGGATYGNESLSFLVTQEMYDASTAGTPWCFRVTLTSATGTLVRSSVTRLSATNDPSYPSFVSVLQKAVVSAGQPHTFQATVTGNPAPTIGWEVSTNGGSIWTDIANNGSPYSFNTTPNGTLAAMSFTATVAMDDYYFRAKLIPAGGMGVVYSQAAHVNVVVPSTTTLTCPAFVTAGSTYACSVHVDGGARARKPCGTVWFKLNGSDYPETCQLGADATCSMAFPSIGAAGSTRVIEALYAKNGLQLCSDGIHRADSSNSTGPTTTVRASTCTAMPTLTCPSATSVTANSSCQAAIPNLVDSTVVSSPGCSATTNQSALAGDMHMVGTVPVTITATNELGSRSCGTSVIVQDRTAPVVNLIGANPLNVACGGYSETAYPVSANDECPGTVQVLTAGTVGGPGQYTLTSTAWDAAGNVGTATRTVNVAPDTVAPTIALSGANPLVVECGSSFSDPGATANDACAGSFAATATGSVNTLMPGPYQITYNATDPTGHAATPVVRQVPVLDTMAPTITVLGINPVSIAQNAPYVDAGAHADDICSGSNLTVMTSGSVNTAVAGTYTITYSVVDGHGNSQSAQRTVNVLAPATATPTVTLTPTPTADANGWRRCASEISPCTSDTAKTCEFSGVQTVRFGVNGTYVYQTTSGPVACTNCAFGSDPVPNVAKFCDVHAAFTPTPTMTPTPTATPTRTPTLSPTNTRTQTGTPTHTPTLTPDADGWTYCAAEIAPCNSGTVKACVFSGVMTVRYGASGAYSYLTTSGPVACTNCAFGGDPAPGVSKSCAVHAAFTPTSTPTMTATHTATRTPTATPTRSATPSPTLTSTVTPSVTNTPTTTPTAPATSTATATELGATPSATLSATPGSVETPSPTATQTEGSIEATASPTQTPSATGQPTATATPSAAADPTATPTLLAGCPAEPASGCFDALQGDLVFRRPLNARRNAFVWRWTNGVTELTQADFGDPTLDGGSLAVCVYDQRGGVLALVFGANIELGGVCPEKPCWEAARPMGWRYRNHSGNADGLRSVVLRGGAAGRPSVVVRGGGQALAAPPPFNTTQLLAQDQSVVVQLSSTTPQRCWSSSFTASSTRRNDALVFRAKASAIP